MFLATFASLGQVANNTVATPEQNRTGSRSKTGFLRFETEVDGIERIACDSWSSVAPAINRSPHTWPNLLRLLCQALELDTLGSDGKCRPKKSGGMTTHNAGHAPCNVMGAAFGVLCHAAQNPGIWGNATGRLTTSGVVIIKRQNYDDSGPEIR